MVSIEYSPNSRARCKKCRGKIDAGSIRICAKGAPVSRSSGYINTYSHATCYTNRKDFTQLWGFRDLVAEDQKRFMTEKQKRAKFPGDYIERVVVADVAAAVVATAPQPVAVGAAATTTTMAPQKRDGSAELEQPAKKKAKKPNPPLTIVGLKYAEARAEYGETVTLVREPENKYDPNAIKVINSSKRQIGHIKKEHATPLSKALDQINSDLPKGQSVLAAGTILDAGDGYQQLVQVVYKKMVAKTKDWDPEQTRANEAKNPYSAKKPIVQTAEAVCLTPKGGGKVAATAVTVSSKKVKDERKQQV
mmetsp:Transcript_31361/g.66013  ORF Transcript_31361/g.66013 Transcript_31361/m.66013 type:complete len:306 (+) Transcript_31361:79-996(+)|eukprot:CAMPEP_0172298978 /NCGR_PEP_ID=MMETSP1058-20130122/1379_1 /TAXON_ID=83371 /ORGANISM="Detonula confervacea, Strain CCMP 353" /LENGTH=305 /DNA_ID=CAMNT_0013008273 /DNA_START=79 /DNA_END=996 /DNA_ORIENTATION=-